MENKTPFGKVTHSKIEWNPVLGKEVAHFYCDGLLPNHFSDKTLLFTVAFESRYLHKIVVDEEGQSDMINNSDIDYEQVAKAILDGFNQN